MYSYEAHIMLVQIYFSTCVTDVNPKISAHSWIYAEMVLASGSQWRIYHAILFHLHQH